MPSNPIQTILWICTFLPFSQWELAHLFDFPHIRSTYSDRRPIITQKKLCVTMQFIGCVHNQKSDQNAPCSQSNPDLLGHRRKIRLCGWIFIKPRPWRMCRKHSNSQFQMANYRDWCIMGYNDVIVNVTVINQTNAFFFIGLYWSHMTNLDRSHFLCSVIYKLSYKWVLNV